MTNTHTHTHTHTSHWNWTSLDWRDFEDMIQICGIFHMTLDQLWLDGWGVEHMNQRGATVRRPFLQCETMTTQHLLTNRGVLKLYLLVERDQELGPEGQEFSVEGRGARHVESKKMKKYPCATEEGGEQNLFFSAQSGNARQKATSPLSLPSFTILLKIPPELCESWLPFVASLRRASPSQYVTSAASSSRGFHVGDVVMFFLTSTAGFLTSTSKFNLAPNWCGSKNGPDHSLTSSKKVDAVTNVKTASCVFYVGR